MFGGTSSHSFKICILKLEWGSIFKTTACFFWSPLFMLQQSVLTLEVLVSGVWCCLGSRQNKAKTFLLLILTWKGPLYPETVRGIPSSVSKECSATLVDVYSRDKVACSVLHPMSGFQTLLQILPHGTAIALSAFPPIWGFLLLHLYIFPCWKSIPPPPCPFLTVRYSMLPHNDEETLLPVTFPGVPSCFSGDILNSFWIVPHTLGCVAASSVPAVRIISSLVQKGLCSYVIVGLVSVPVSQWKQRIEGVLNQTCCLSATASESVNLILPYTWTPEKTWLLKGTHGFLKGIG